MEDLDQINILDETPVKIDTHANDPFITFPVMILLTQIEIE